MAKNIVYTETTCGRCGKVQREEGARNEVPPCNWSECQISKRLLNHWADKHLLDIFLCPECTEIMLKDSQGS